MSGSVPIYDSTYLATFVRYTLCPKKRPRFYFSNNSVKKLTSFNNFLVCEMLKKFHINSLYICPPFLCTVATLPWEIQNKIIFQRCSCCFSLQLLAHFCNFTEFPPDYESTNNTNL